MCSQCGHSFYTKQRLEQHFATHTASLADPPRLAQLCMCGTAMWCERADPHANAQRGCAARDHTSGISTR